MSISVKQCKRCNRIFQSYGASYCPECAAEMEEEFDKVRHYLYEHSNANVFEIVKETGVSERAVLSFLKEGRLSIGDNNGFLKCENCGAPIDSGRYCAKCIKRLGNALDSDLANQSARELEEEVRKRFHGIHREFRND